MEFIILEMLDECEKLVGMRFYLGLDHMLGYYVVPIKKMGNLPVLCSVGKSGNGKNDTWT